MIYYLYYLFITYLLNVSVTLNNIAKNVLLMQFYSEESELREDKYISPRALS